MFSLFYLFVGAVVGLLLVSVFAPPLRKDLQVPMPESKQVFNTPSGCVKFKAKKVPCTDKATSLNLLASQHK